MNEEMRVEAMELCVTACEKFAANNEVSNNLKPNQDFILLTLHLYHHFELELDGLILDCAYCYMLRQVRWSYFVRHFTTSRKTIETRGHNFFFRFFFLFCLF